jgi:hypothetical protein
MAPHQWTQFEERTLLALMARGVHIIKVPDNASERSKNNFIDIATALNAACNGRSEYENDIPIKDIVVKVNEIKSRKATMAFMDREKVGHLTRAMSRVYERGVKSDGLERKQSQGGHKDQQDNAETTSQIVAPNPWANAGNDDVAQDDVTTSRGTWIDEGKITICPCKHKG